MSRRENSAERAARFTAVYKQMSSGLTLSGPCKINLQVKREMWWFNREVWWLNGSALKVPGSNPESLQPKADSYLKVCAAWDVTNWSIGCPLDGVRGKKLLKDQRYRCTHEKI